jgi:hypothetical protein
MTKKIPVGQDDFAIVDDEDYEVLSQYKWHLMANSTKTHKYAATKMRMHRFIMNPPKGFVVDHINGDTLDNRRQNLRICTNAQNQQNTGSRGGTSKYKGVSFNIKSDKWLAAFQYDGVNYYCGLWDDEEDAARAVDKKRGEVCGDFASKNFPDDE